MLVGVLTFGTASIIYPSHSHARIQAQPVGQELGRARISVPKRIRVRWVQHHNLPQQDRYQYRMNSSLAKAKVCAEEFFTQWAYVRARLSDDKLFSLFNFGFSPREHDVTRRLAFVRTVLQRYTDAKVFYVHLQCFAYVHSLAFS